jgi:rhamnosyltransferase subunit B
MHVLLIPYGVAGDVLPLVRAGIALRDRGHRATLVASGYFQDLARKEGLDFLELYSAAEYADEVFSPRNDRLRLIRFLRHVHDKLLQRMGTAYDLIAEHYVPGETVVAAQGWVLGARIAQEKLGVPLATVHMQPLTFGSAYDRRWMPPWMWKLCQPTVRRLMDRVLGGGVNAFRAGLGLAPVSGIMRWWHSPELVIGLFPDWFSAPQPDWPPNSRLVGFPLLDLPTQGSGSADELDQFIAEGEPPIIFSQGSVKRHVRNFFEVSAEVARQLGGRALFLTPHAEQVRLSLPSHVRYFGFVPLRLPRRAAVHVHHGGVGTMAYTLAAGIPQLTVPLTLDQPDNCWRLRRLGVSDTIRPRQYTTRRVVRKLEALLASPLVAERCRFYAARCREETPMEGFCNALEELHARHGRLSTHVPEAVDGRR